MAEFIISDTHFSHANVIDFDNRLFSNVDEMNELMIEAWNKEIGKTDTVYHLGDFSFGGRDNWFEILDRLKGNIVLIKGNHDKTRIVNRMKTEGLLSELHPLGTVIKRDGIHLNLSHYPMMIGNRRRQYSIHGHIHTDSMDTDYHINVGVDNKYTKDKTYGKLFGTPIPLDLVVEDILIREARFD